MKKYLFLVILLVLFSSGCDKNSWPIVWKRKITYIVSGTSNDYSIRYLDEYGHYQNKVAKSDWEYEFKAKPDKYLFLSAKKNIAEGSVVVRIKQGGNVVSEAQTTAPNGAATVSCYVN